MMDKIKKIYPYLLIIAFSLIIYFPNLWFDYAYLDDNLIVFEEYHKINSLSKSPSAFVEGYLYDTYYRPIIMISFIIDTVIAGQSSAMYHLTNLLIHIIVSILVYIFLKKITQHDFLSLLFALLYSVHPLNLNAVSWIAGRNDLLVTLFTLLSILLFIKYWEEGKKIYLFLVSLCYSLAMFSKEIGVLIPLAGFFYILIFKTSFSCWLSFVKTKKKELILSIAAFALPYIIYFIFRFYLAHFNERQEINLVLFQNISILFEYLAKVFYFFEFSPLAMFSTTLTVLGVLVSALIAVIFILNKRIDRKKFLFGLIIFLLFVLPPIFVKITASDGEFNYIDCRMYLPLIGVFVFLISIIQTYKVLINKIGTLLSISAILLYAVTFNAIENQYYRNGEKFWSRLVEIYPKRATYWIGLGFYYFDNKDFLKAAMCAERAIKLKPKKDEFYKKGALAYMNSGNNNKAIQLMEKVLRLENDHSSTYLNLIKCNLEIGQIKQAEKYTQKLLTCNINKVLKAELIYSASISFFNSRHYKQSIELMKKTISLEPSTPKYCNDLGIILKNTGREDSAKFYFQKAFELEQSNSQLLCKQIK